MCFFALNMTWTYCEVYWDLDFEPSENQWRAASGIGGVRYLAWRLFFVLGFDNSSMGAKPWKSRKAQSAQSHKPAQFKQNCLGSLSHVPRVCAFGHWNTSSRTPLIIFVFGEFGSSVSGWGQEQSTLIHCDCTVAPSMQFPSKEMLLFQRSISFVFLSESKRYRYPFSLG